VRTLLTFVLLFAGCAHELSERRARSLGCKEACAREAVFLGKSGSTGSSIDDKLCVCQFDDGVVDYTCRRPSDYGSCS